MPAHDPLFHAANLMPAQPENQILHFAQNDRGEKMAEDGGMTKESGMTADGGMAADTP